MKLKKILIIGVVLGFLGVVDVHGSGPDLVINDFWIDWKGQLCYEMTNIGDVTATAEDGFWYTCVYINGNKYEARDRVGDKLPGVTESLHFMPTYYYYCLIHNPLKVCVDCEGDIDETDETNNCMVKTVGTQGADLVTTDVWVDAADRVCFEIKNIGDTNAADIRIEGDDFGVFLFTNTYSYAGAWRRISYLNVGEARSHCFHSSDYTYDPADEPIYVCVDKSMSSSSSLMICESDETNNCIRYQSTSTTTSSTTTTSPSTTTTTVLGTTTTTPSTTTTSPSTTTTSPSTSTTSPSTSTTSPSTTTTTPSTTTTTPSTSTTSPSTTTTSPSTTTTIEDCGTDSCDPWGYYCSGDNVRRSRTCCDRGESGGSCYENCYTEDEFMQDCGWCSGWYDYWGPYSCCSGIYECTCQDQDHLNCFCRGGACDSVWDGARTLRWGCGCVEGECGAECSDGQTRPCNRSTTWDDHCSGEREEHFIDYDGSGGWGAPVTTTCNIIQTCQADCLWPASCCTPAEPGTKIDWGHCDQSEPSCTLCCLAHWNIGGDIPLPPCCGDDPGEHRLACSKAVDVAEDACGGDNESCCPRPTDCIYNDHCYESGWCHPTFRNIYCDSGTWRYDRIAPTVNINLPTPPVVYEGNRSVEFDITEDHCDIAEDTVTVKVNGTTWRNRYFDENSTSFNGAIHCNPWPQDYWSPYPNLNANYMDCGYSDESLIQPGAITLTVCAEDGAGNMGCAHVDFKYLVETEIKGMCYRWNSISLPLLPIDSAGNPDTDTSSTQILRGLPYDRLARHRVEDIFDSFAPEIPPVITQSLTELEVGKGYFIFINDTGKAHPNCIDKSYYGIPDPSDPQLVMNTSGWYFFGIQSNSPLLDDTINDTLSANGITPENYTGIYYYDKSLHVPYGDFVRYHPTASANPFNRFETGKGYWINYTGPPITLPLY